MPVVSIVIPTLNEADSIKQTLEVCKRFGEKAEIIVVDGGSVDETVSIAKNFNARILTAPRGRGSQMHVGASAAKTQTLWFLHADTTPPENAVEGIQNALENPEIVGGNFTILFDGGGRAARFLTWLYPNLRKIGLCYGDSAIFVRREIYEKIGGFEPFPIFEDLDLVRKMRRVGRMANLGAKVVTSSRRFEKNNFALVFTRWTFLQILYWLGFSPYFLSKLYFPVRRKPAESRGRTTL